LAAEGTDEKLRRIQDSGTNLLWVYDTQAAVVAATTAVPPTVTSQEGVVEGEVERGIWNCAAIDDDSFRLEGVAQTHCGRK